MVMYFVMVEAIPNRNNPEGKQFGGAYINCWVKAATRNDAIARVWEYVGQENWMIVKIEDIFVAQRHLYMEIPDSLACYDDAYRNGISALFYTWPIDEVCTN